MAKLLATFLKIPNYKSMRKIKFRVWHKKHKRWLTDNDSSLHCSSHWMMDIFTGNIFDIVECGGNLSFQREVSFYTEGEKIIEETPLVVQRFTGLKDKNDVDIYEGDILERIGDGSFCKIVVYWDSHNCAFFIKNSFDLHGRGSPISDHYINISDWTYWVVCGNIIENKDLLSEEL